LIAGGIGFADRRIDVVIGAWKGPSADWGMGMAFGGCRMGSNVLFLLDSEGKSGGWRCHEPGEGLGQEGFWI
jgi:hypothetical protein